MSDLYRPHTELLVPRAFEVAWVAHLGQMYGPEPYINHCMRVSSVFKEDFLRAAALLHDVAEDTRYHLAYIAHFFGDPMANTIHSLTRMLDEPYMEYIERCRQDPRARQIKIADLRENLHYARIRGEYCNLVPRYEKALSIIDPDI